MNIIILVILLLTTACIILLIPTLSYQKYLSKDIPDLFKKVEERVSRLEESEKKLTSHTDDLGKQFSLLLDEAREADKQTNKQLKKVEDLYIHAIELQKQLTDLKHGEPPKPNKDAYNDAAVAFNNVNAKFYNLRKHKDLCHKLIQMLYDGKDMKLDLSNVTEEDREKAVTLRGNIRTFNINYRPQLIAYLERQGKKWEECVRFPLNKIYDPAWDEEMLGNEIEEGTVIDRVVQLGFEFQDSPVIGRTKSKVIVL